jgi:heme-degrading monooxygenase HmoA
MPSDGLAKTPHPPYYAVIFTSLRTERDNGYSQMADSMDALASQQPGFLGVESVRSADGLGITVSYWESEEAIRNWKKNAEHKVAQELGKQIWYQSYMVRVAKIERNYGKQSLHPELKSSPKREHKRRIIQPTKTKAR